MKKLLSLFVFTLVICFAGTVFAQEKMEETKPTDKDKTELIPTGGVMKRGAPLSKKTKKADLKDVMKNPEKYAGKTVMVKGVIVRSCKMEGCWMELAPTADSAKAVRVKFKDHKFFIPLDSAGATAQVEGVFSVKTLSKAEVDHLVNDDKAKVDNINADGTATEISFEATGIELAKATK